ncbi:PRTRC system protein E [Mucilaginibacter defluvii]|uniref:ParB-related ThiF-related cassette protein E domain-containing protein n=1 Tax=Mucilaginibacter defluvii TaxID=1196019 RepID=A0ABP9FUH1_9SPHI
MNTNFFSQIAGINFSGDLQLTISKGAGENLIVSMLPINEHCSDNAKFQIIPFNYRGTATDLDSEFFDKVAKPIEAASGLIDNMEAFMKQLEEAKKQSAIERDKADKEKRAKDEKEKKYKEAMQKVDELEKEGKYKDAWMKVPDTALFPENAEAIQKRKSSLSQKFAPDLFGSVSVPEEKVTTQAPDNTPAEDHDGTDYQEEEDWNEEEQE